MISVVPELFKEHISAIETATENLTFSTKSLDFGKNKSLIVDELTLDQIRFTTILNRYKTHMGEFTGTLRAILEYFEAVDAALGYDIAYDRVDQPDQGTPADKTVGNLRDKVIKTLNSDKEGEAGR